MKFFCKKIDNPTKKVIKLVDDFGGLLPIETVNSKYKVNSPPSWECWLW